MRLAWAAVSVVVLVAAACGSGGHPSPVLTELMRDPIFSITIPGAVPGQVGGNAPGGLPHGAPLSAFREWRLRRAAPESYRAALMAERGAGVAFVSMSCNGDASAVGGKSVAGSSLSVRVSYLPGDEPKILVRAEGARSAAAARRPPTIRLLAYQPPPPCPSDLLAAAGLSPSS